MSFVRLSIDKNMAGKEIKLAVQKYQCNDPRAKRLFDRLFDLARAPKIFGEFFATDSKETTLDVPIHTAMIASLPDNNKYKITDYNPCMDYLLVHLFQCIANGQFLRIIAQQGSDVVDEWVTFRHHLINFLMLPQDRLEYFPLLERCKVEELILDGVPYMLLGELSKIVATNQMPTIKELSMKINPVNRSDEMEHVVKCLTQIMEGLQKNNHLRMLNIKNLPLVEKQHLALLESAKAAISHGKNLTLRKLDIETSDGKTSQALTSMAKEIQAHLEKNTSEYKLNIAEKENSMLKRELDELKSKVAALEANLSLKRQREGEGSPELSSASQHLVPGRYLTSFAGLTFSNTMQTAGMQHNHAAESDEPPNKRQRKN